MGGGGGLGFWGLGLGEGEGFWGMEAVSAEDALDFG